MFSREKNVHNCASEIAMKMGIFELWVFNYLNNNFKYSLRFNRFSL